ncbi:MAG: hypothetical protein JWM74_2644 [Myxococcaceae bacterium]|nr:hypothetical protein [Myxococcaceae bacterium]
MTSEVTLYAEGEDDVFLTVGRASFGRRVLIAARSLRSAFLLMTLLVLVFPSFLAAIIVAKDGVSSEALSYPWWLAAISFAVGLVPLALRFVVALTQSNTLPRAIVVRANGLVIVPAAGDAFDASWSWLVSVRHGRDWVELELPVLPVCVLRVSRASIDERAFTRLHAWASRKRD